MAVRYAEPFLNSTNRDIQATQGPASEQRWFLRSRFLADERMFAKKAFVVEHSGWSSLRKWIF
jgi:hypothetical protein